MKTLIRIFDANNSLTEADAAMSKICFDREDRNVEDINCQSSIVASASEPRTQPPEFQHRAVQMNCDGHA